MITQAFYTDLQAWIDNGMPLHNAHNFDAQFAICSNFKRWSRSRHLPADRTKARIASLQAQFAAKGLHYDCPFNNGRYLDFNQERENNEFYKNPARLAWIKDRAKVHP